MSDERISFEEARAISIRKWGVIAGNLDDLGAKFSADCGFCMRGPGCSLCEGFEICKGRGAEFIQASMLLENLQTAVDNLIDAIKELEE